MIRQFRMVFFHLQQFVRVPYFIQLMVVSTLSLVLIQFLAYIGWGGTTNLAWIRGGVIGMWTTCTSAAGALGFERYKGTLVYLLSSSLHPLRSLFSVVSAASLFGLCAFPLSWISWNLIALLCNSQLLDLTFPSFTVLVAIFLLWLSCLSVTFVISSIFVLTPNALVYEDLLLRPVLILSGILFIVRTVPAWLMNLGNFFPLYYPVRLLVGEEFEVYKGLIWFLVLLFWIFASICLGLSVLRKARVLGTLDLI